MPINPFTAGVYVATMMATVTVLREKVRHDQAVTTCSSCSAYATGSHVMQRLGLHCASHRLSWTCCRVFAFGGDYNVDEHC